MFLSFAIGISIGIVLAWSVVQLRARRELEEEVEAEEAPQPVEITQRLRSDFASRVVNEAEDQLQSLARSVGRELAAHSTAVQGNAQLLCEGTFDPSQVARRCEDLWTSVGRLRRMAEKLLAFAIDRPLERGPLDIHVFLEDVKGEIETTHGTRLNVQVATTPSLPHAFAHARSLRLAVHCLVETLLEVEPRTRSLSIAAYEDADDDSNSIGIEICAEAGAVEPDEAQTDDLQLGYLAACRTLEAQGARLSIHQLEGVSSTAFITLDAEHDGVADERAGGFRSDLQEVHEFGGVMVLERDPSVRAMIATEIDRHGRKILNCVEVNGARALLEATPERFELLILEVQDPHGEGVALAREALQRNPDIRVLLITGVADAPELERSLGSGVGTLCKPFGMLELRKTLARMLASDPASR